MSATHGYGPHNPHARTEASNLHAAFHLLGRADYLVLTGVDGVALPEPLAVEHVRLNPATDEMPVDTVDITVWGKSWMFGINVQAEMVAEFRVVTR